jgi:peroxiredoxin
MRLAVAILLLLSPFFFDQVARADDRIGKPAPGFSLRDREGTLISLSDLVYPGRAKPRRPKKVVVLDFFRTDCKPCITAIPKLIELHQKYQPHGVQVILIALLEESQGEKKLESFLKKHKLPFKVLVDRYAVVGKKYIIRNGVVRIPALFVIDKNGILRGTFQGMKPRTLPALYRLIADILT